MSQGHAASAAGGVDVTLRRLAAGDGTAAHAFALRLAAPRAPTRDLVDAVHALCAVYGHHPDLLTLAARGDSGEARTWMLAAASAFAAERAALAQLVAAAGPLPSTPGQAETAAALNTERQTLDQLARSERAGVALGAAAALVLDWQAIRPVFARAADRFGVTLRALDLPDPARVLGEAESAARAIAFGAQQLLAQHRGLWSLLEARSSARGD